MMTACPRDENGHMLPHNCEEHRADAAKLTALDWHTITCQCEQYRCTQNGGCQQAATHQIEFHALDQCNQTDTIDGDTINPFGNYVFLLCHACLDTLAAVVTTYVERLTRYGRPLCQTCGAPVAELSDVIREVRSLS